MGKKTFKILHHKINHLVVIVLELQVCTNYSKYIVQDGDEHIHNNPVHHDVKTKKKYRTENCISIFKLTVTEFPQQQ